MDERRDEYGFCPKCGAVMQNGVCQSCGHGKRLGMPAASPADTRAAYESGIPEKKKMSGIAKVVIVLVVILVILLAVFAGLTIRAVVGQKDQSSGLHIDDGFFGGYYDDGSDDYYDDWYDDDDWDYDYDDYSYEEYVPSPDDEYYKEIVDATAQGLSYEIEWHGYSIYPDNEECYFSSTTPYIISSDGELMDTVNSRIQEAMFKYRDDYRNYSYGAYSIGYVTYMDEERLSVVVRHDLEDSDYSNSRYELDAVTFDMSTGQVIPYEELVQADMEMVKKFRSQNSLQNDTMEFIDELTDEELLEYIQNDEKRVVFLTPVGTELGFNFDGGWVTVTLKSGSL